METWVSKDALYRGKIVTLEVGDVRIDDGSLAKREVVLHPGGVGVVPVVDDYVILVKQFRIAINRDIVEIPAGRLEPNEAPESTACREMIEEIGYEVGRLVHVASCYCSPGFTNELDHIYLAFDLKKTVAQPEHDERIEQVIIPIAELPGMLARGEFDDAKTIVGLQALLVHLATNGSAC